LAKQISKIPEVLEVHHIAGEDCFLVKSANTGCTVAAAVNAQPVGKIPNITSTKTTIVLDTSKEDNYLLSQNHKNGNTYYTVKKTAQSLVIAAFAALYIIWALLTWQYFLQ